MPGLVAAELADLLPTREMSFYDLKAGDVIIRGKDIFWIATLQATEGDYSIVTSDGFELRGSIRSKNVLEKFQVIKRSSLAHQRIPTVRYRSTEVTAPRSTDIPDEFFGMEL